jgi:glycosyltransferase involved in cell wall biosynthesis
MLMSGAWLPSYRELAKQALAACGELIVSNEFLAKKARHYQSNVQVVPGGVSQLFLEANSDVKPPGNARNLRVGMFGRSHDPAKGFSVLLEAVLKLEKRGLDVELWATDPPATGKACVKPLPWSPLEEMPKRYASVDVVAVPSVWNEPFGLVAIEGMALGRPVVASNLGGLSHLVSDHRDGFLVPPGDPDALACRIELLYKDRELLQAMGVRGQEKVARHYTWDEVYRRWYRDRWKN